MTVAVHVTDNQSMYVRAGFELDGLSGGKAAVAVTQINAHGISPAVGRYEIEVSVLVEVRKVNNGFKAPVVITDREAGTRCVTECAAVIGEKCLHGLGAIIFAGDRQDGSFSAVY